MKERTNEKKEGSDDKKGKQEDHEIRNGNLEKRKKKYAT